MNPTTLDIYSPFDNSLIKTIPLKSADEAKQLLETAHHTFKDKSQWLPIHERLEILKRLAQLVRDEIQEFAMLIAKEGGKPLTDALIEVTRAIDGIELAGKELMSVFKGEEIPMGMTAASHGKRAHTFYEPAGVVIAVSAFNHPLNLIVHQVVPAIAVGCPIIIKPASSTPLNCLRFIELVHLAGLPPQWCQACVCHSSVANELVKSSNIAFFSFIGSAHVGWSLKSQLAHGVHCALEHGGVAPVIVDESTNLKNAIPKLLKGGFYHAGQVCVSVQRIYVHKNIITELSESFASLASELKVGPATEVSTEVGPLISSKEVDRIHDWVQEAIEAGAICLTGGTKLSETTYAPTVLLNPPESTKVSCQEVFGPVVCLYEYDDLDEALQRANQLDFAFQAAVFSEQQSVINYVIDNIDASAVMVNDHTAFRVDWMPFTGRRHSGYGIGGIGYTMKDMCQLKMVVR